MIIYNKYNVLAHSLLVASTLLGMSFVTGSAYAEERVRLNFGVYSSNKPTAMVRTFKPILNTLETNMAEKLGVDVDIRMQIAKGYDQGIADLANGKVDFSRFGPASYVEAKHENEDLEILAMENVQGDKVFYGIIAVHKDSTISEVSQLRNKSFAFGDESSTIGRYLSQQFLEQNNIRSSDLRKFEYLGRHDKVGTAVGAGDFEAGALNESTFKKLIAKGEPIRELARFPNVTKPWIARKGLTPEVFAALRDSLLELNDEAELKSLKVVGFLPGSDADYQTIRNSIANNDRFFEEPEPVNVTEPKSAAAQPALAVQPGNGANAGNAANATVLTLPGSIQINIQFQNAEHLLSGAVAGSTDPVLVNVLINGQNFGAAGSEVTAAGD